jgi:hypothetical protein
MANHPSTRTTQLYDRRRDEVSLESGIDPNEEVRPEPDILPIVERPRVGRISVTLNYAKPGSTVSYELL